MRTTPVRTTRTAGIMKLLLTIISGMLMLNSASMAMKTPSFKNWDEHSYGWGQVQIKVNVPSNMTKEEAGVALKNVITDGEVTSQMLLDRSFVYRPRLRIFPVDYGEFQVRMFIETIPKDDIAFVNEYGLGKYLYKYYKDRYVDPNRLGYGTYEKRARTQVIDIGKISWEVWQELDEVPDNPVSEMQKTVFWCLRLDNNHYFLVLFAFINNVDVGNRDHKWYVNAAKVEREIMSRIEVEGLN